MMTNHDAVIPIAMVPGAVLVWLFLFACVLAASALVIYATMPTRKRRERELARERELRENELHERRLAKHPDTGDTGRQQRAA